MTILTNKYLQNYIISNKIDTTKPFNLNLSSNQITSIEKDAFKDCNNLVQLSLNDNNLISIEKDAFKDCNNFEYLNLSSNQIPFIENKYYVTREEILRLIKDLNILELVKNLKSLDKEVDNLDCLIDGNTTLNDIKDKIGKYKQEIIEQINN